ncbi:Tol-Pal system beta propeller repeat protein TolB [Iodidimonas sp. SYSU 1G8]|uniref:Tol-Pal system beta propeller repeat protein TolB n=1 Tax=Iodidimonas sp. SYSU 1G8 TaxID=3133967 RepID=UPI0031FF1F31
MGLSGLVAGTMLAFVALVQPQPASAQLRVDINNPTVEPIPMALPAFSAQSQVPSRLTEMTKMGEDMAGVIAADLERSGLFRPIPRQAYIEQGLVPDRRPRFPDWKSIGTQGLVVGGVNFLADGRVEVTFRLWDVYGQQQLTGVQYQTTPDNWRQIAHRIADAVYQRLTGEEGYFDTRIVYVAESGPATKRVKRLAIMDQDGYNHSFLTKGDFMALTPRFSPTSQEITYLSYFNNKPRVYIYNLETGKQELLGDFSGMTFAPRFSPDGNQVVMSMEKNGNSDIYLMDLRTRKLRQLTDNPDIDTAPSFSPDGQFIAFESDRGGGQQIYVMRADGSGAKRISFGKGRYKTPVWSPRGDMIAFTHTSGGVFKIGVMRPDGSGERMLTESFLDEGPTWAPNGRVLMYFRGSPSRGGNAGKAELRSIDLTGRNERRVTTPGDASDPAWSPLIQ